jgi:hypothetical protein
MTLGVQQRETINYKLKTSGAAKIKENAIPPRNQKAGKFGSF